METPPGLDLRWLPLRRAPTALRAEFCTAIVPLVAAGLEDPAAAARAGEEAVLAPLSATGLEPGAAIRLRSAALWTGWALVVTWPPDGPPARWPAIRRVMAPRWRSHAAESIASSTGRLALAALEAAGDAGSAAGGLIDRMARLSRMACEDGASAAEPASGERVDRLRQRVETRLRQPASLRRAAREVGLHPVYLARLFRRRYGCSYGTFVHRRRIDLAAAALGRRHHLDLAGLALDLGFADQSHMTRVFRRHLGWTPAAFASFLRRSAASDHPPASILGPSAAPAATPGGR